MREILIKKNEKGYRLIRLSFYPLPLLDSHVCVRSYIDLIPRELPETIESKHFLIRKMLEATVCDPFLVSKFFLGDEKIKKKIDKDTSNILALNHKRH